MYYKIPSFIPCRPTLAITTPSPSSTSSEKFRQKAKSVIQTIIPFGKKNNRQQITIWWSGICEAVNEKRNRNDRHQMHKDLQQPIQQSLNTKKKTRCQKSDDLDNVLLGFEDSQRKNNAKLLKRCDSKARDSGNSSGSASTTYLTALNDQPQAEEEGVLIIPNYDFDLPGPSNNVTVYRNGLVAEYQLEESTSEEIVPPPRDFGCVIASNIDVVLYCHPSSFSSHISANASLKVHTGSPKLPIDDPSSLSILPLDILPSLPVPTNTPATIRAPAPTTAIVYSRRYETSPQRPLLLQASFNPSSTKKPAPPPSRTQFPGTKMTQQIATSHQKQKDECFRKKQRNRRATSSHEYSRGTSSQQVVLYQPTPVPHQQGSPSSWHRYRQLQQYSQRRSRRSNSTLVHIFNNQSHHRSNSRASYSYDDESYFNRVEFLRRLYDLMVPDSVIQENPRNRMHIGGNIGEGLNGAIQVARDLPPKHPESRLFFAVKNMIVHSSRFASILTEVRLMRAYHPNLVELRQLFYHRNQVSLMMELMTCSVFNLMTEIGGGLQEKYVVYILYEVARALKFLHNNVGYFHGDIKCENILLGPYGQIKLADFGLSAPCGDERECSVGTMEWMAPEVADDNKTSNEQSDMWSLGMTLIEMLDYGLPLIDDKKIPRSEAKRLIARISTPPSLQRATASRTMNHMIHHLLQINPRQRPTPSHLVRFLTECLRTGTLVSANANDMTELLLHLKIT